MSTSRTSSCLFTPTFAPTSQNILDDMAALLKQKFDNHLVTLKGMDLNEFVSKIEAAQNEIIAAVPLSSINVRKIAVNRILQTLCYLSQDNHTAQFIFRHGEQDAGDAKTNDVVQNKILMMQATHNKNDPITIASAIEFLSTLAIMMYLQANCNAEFCIESSPNKRAQQPAQALATLLNRPLQIHEKWACVNYPDDLTEEQKTLLKEGTLPWTEKAVDEIVGAGTFEKIKKNMQAEVEAALHLQNRIKIVFTHTQQINAICESLSLDTPRLENYGYLYSGQTNHAELYKEGFYVNQATPISNPRTKLK